jgi:hypothetical protein
MTDDTLRPFDLPAVRRKKLTVDFAGGNQSSDAGLLLFREAERKLGICRRLADAMPDDRDQSRVRHQMFELVMACSSAIACGHKNGNDYDRLRHGPLMKTRHRPLPSERCDAGVASACITVILGHHFPVRPRPRPGECYTVTGRDLLRTGTVRKCQFLT